MIIKVRLTGTSPLLMNRFTERDEIAIRGGIIPIREDSSPRAIAKEKAYISKETEELYIPVDWLFGALVNAARYVKPTGHAGGALDIAGWITLPLALIPLGTKEFEVDTRSANNPKTKGKMIIHRPRIDAWSCTFEFTIDETMYGIDVARDLFDKAGKRSGLGDYRPAKKGPFGCFNVTEWSPKTENLVLVG